MQRVSAFLPSWDKRSSGASKASNSRNSGGGFFGWTNRNSGSSSSASRGPSHINVVAANAPRVQREAFWPASLDVECDKAARILKSFCTDGYLAPDEPDNTTPKHARTRSSTDASLPLQSPAIVTKKIPRRIIQNAAGIAVFTCMRSGLWMTGSGGSGILIARKSDGTWSPPSGILLHTPTLSFIIGVDVYDCVLVVNNVATLESITRPRVTLGEDVHLTNGPSVPIDSDEAHIDWRRLGDSVLAYMKARGQHQAVNLNGCILAERTNENERFYDAAVTQMDILAGNVSRNVDETVPLFEVIKMAEGRTDFDAAVVSMTDVKPAPGDVVIATPQSTPASPIPSFGFPPADDPDPYGVLALEMAGLEIREAGSRLRPTSSQFDLNSAPLSPSLFRFNRHSVETFTTRSNRASVLSTRTIKSQATDAYAHNDANTPETTPSPGPSDDGLGAAPIERILEVKEDDDDSSISMHPKPIQPSDQQAIYQSSTAPIKNATLVVDSKVTTQAATMSSGGVNEGAAKRLDNADDEDDEDDPDHADDVDDDDEDPVVVYEVAAAQPASTRAVASRVIHARGNVVTIPKRIPPPLPRRSSARTSRPSRSEDGGDTANIESPLRQAVSDEDLRTEEDTSISRRASNGEKSTEYESGGEIAVRADGLLAEYKPILSPYRAPLACFHKDGPHGLQSQSDDDGINTNEAMSSSTPTEETSKWVTAASLISMGNEEIGKQGDAAKSQSNDGSLYTGATEDCWSCNDSSLTTSTFDGRRSLTEASKSRHSISGLMQDSAVASVGVGSQQPEGVTATLQT
ncbi:hypothetical protein CDD82_990 [Ophiocordyceps australis]|uniref:Ysc84 actin-binding domain-containing protein n=1 Tax=Ophiocordyceps australis TaxID=1399860 RepID=A0A2C5ZNE0_9HYPO|nr:hypothetical protein CDD82_990 [Ophiocordyceps australis]